MYAIDLLFLCIILFILPILLGFITLNMKKSYVKSIKIEPRIDVKHKLNKNKFTGDYGQYK